MVRFYLHKYLLVCGLLFVCLTAVAQDCSLDQTIVIQDADTTAHTVLVSGLTNDILGENGQGLCKVNLEMTHEYLGDLIVYLYAPSGQSVILMGPPTTNSSQTDQITWDVGFVPRSFPSSPDNGINEVWDNFSNWLTFTTYTGCYYPFFGDLEDFNSSSANGVWSISFIDGSPIGEGNLINFELIFCDPDGLNCTDCIADGGIIENEYHSFCQGDDPINVEVDLSFPQGDPDASIYDYTVVISNDQNKIVEYSDLTSEMTEYEPGLYNLCGLGYLIDQQDQLPPLQSDVSSLLDIINTGHLCGEFSSSCVVVEIHPVSDTTFLHETICLSQEFNLNGEIFNTEGIHIIEVSASPCDTVIVLDLKIEDQEAIIDPQMEFLSCSTPSINLNGSNSIILSDSEIEWKTLDGNILTETSETFISVGSPGTYWLVLNNEACSDSVSIVVPESLDGPDLDISAGVLSCTQPETTIDLSSSIPLDDLIWDGPLDFTESNSSFDVTLPGTYYVTVTDENECLKEDSILIEYSYAMDIPSFEFDSVECNQDFIQVFTTIDNPSIYTFNWSNNSGFTSSEMSPQVPEEGIYILELENNNCTEIHIVEVLRLEVFPYDLKTLRRSITCTTVGRIRVDFSEPVLNFTFKGPDNFTTTDQEFTTDIPGWYYLCAEMEDGCTYLDSTEITIFIEPAPVMIRDTTIGCNPQPLEILVESTHALSAYNWTGPNNFMSQEEAPMIINPGTYYVTVTSAWSNCETLDTFLLLEDIVTPILTFDGDLEVNCSYPQSLIEIFSDVPAVNYEWNGPQTVGNVAEEYLSQGGEYSVVVTSENNCTEEIVVIIDQDIELPRYQLFTDHINCENNGVATVSLVPEEQGYIYQWSGPQNFSAVSDQFTVSEAGRYVVTVTGPNGCSNETGIDILSDYQAPVITEITDGVLNCESLLLVIGVETDGDIETWEWSGPDNYSFDQQYPVISEEGNYTVTFTQENGCFGFYDFSIEMDTISPIVQVYGTEINCIESKSELSFTSNSNDIEYKWEGPDNFTSDELNPVVNVPGVYFLYVFGTNGCGTVKTFEVIENFELPNVEAYDASLPCDGSSMNLPVSSSDLGTTFQWFGPNMYYSEEQTPEVTEMGDYIVVATGLNGCIKRDTITVDDEPVLPIFDYESGTITCLDPEVVLLPLNINDDIFIKWISPDGAESFESDYSVSEPGEYSLIISSIQGCLDTALVEVDIDTISPLAIAKATEELKCEITTMQLDGTDSDLGQYYRPSWVASNGGTILEGEDSYTPLIMGAGTYTLTNTDIRNGCSQFSELEVYEFPNTLESIFFDTSDPFCEGFLNGSVHVLNVDGGQEPFAYSINGGYYISNPDFFYLAPGDYELSVKDDFGCEIDTVFTINAGVNPTIEIGNDTLISLGDTLSISALTNLNPDEIESISWSYSDVECIGDDCLDISLAPLESTQLLVEITDINGCTSMDDIYIRIEDESPIYIPNAFSPNDDGNNDFFMIYGGKGVVKINVINILDRWGNIVFEDFDFNPENPINSWTGMYRGELLPAGVYAYILTYDLIDGTTRQQAGNITLIR